MDAVRQWAYKPTLLNGNAVEGDTTVTVVFELGGTPRQTPSEKAQVPPTSPPAPAGPPEHGQEAKAFDVSQEPYVYEQVRGTMRYENDGTGTLDIKARVKVQSAMGIEKIGQLVFEYNSANERLDIVRIQVTKPNGHIITTGADAVQDLMRLWRCRRQCTVMRGKST